MNPIKIFFDKFKIYFFVAFILVFIYFYFQNQNLKTDLKIKNDDLVEQKNINDLTIKAYEQTLEIEKEKNTFEITTQKEKEPLIKISEKVKQEVQNVKKYKEVKQDEKECPKLGTFKL